MVDNNSRMRPILYVQNNVMDEDLTLKELLHNIRMQALGNRICIVDDDYIILKVITRALKRKGYKCVSCMDGEEFKNVLKNEGDIGLVITDLVMPNINGIEVIETLAKYKIPCIAMTSARNGDDIVTEVRCHRVPILFKPIDMHQLFVYVLEVFGGPK